MLDRGVGSFGRGSHAGDQLVASSGVGVRVRVLGRDLDADAGPGVLSWLIYLTRDTLVGSGF